MAAPTRILCFVHAPDLGGVERAALRLCRAWADAGSDVAVALGRTDGALIALGSTRVHEAPRIRLQVAAFETLWMIWWLTVVLRRERPDVLFCPGNSYTVVAVMIRLLFWRGCPPIVAKISNDLERHDLPAPARFLYRLWCWLQGRLIDRFIALSPAMRARSGRMLLVPPSRIGVAVNAALDEVALGSLAGAGAAARATRGPGRRFVCAGRLVPQKNPLLLIDAFAGGAEPGDSLTIVGDGPLHARIAARIAALGLDGQVRLAGRCGAAAQWLSRCDVLLISSDYEGLPAVAVEALAAGITVIATDCCASMGALLAGGHGALVRPRDPGALGRAIASADPDAIDRAAATARARGFTAAATAPAFLRQLRIATLPTPQAPAALISGERPA